MVCRYYISRFKRLAPSLYSMLAIVYFLVLPAIAADLISADARSAHHPKKDQSGLPFHTARAPVLMCEVLVKGLLYLLFPRQDCFVSTGMFENAHG